MNAKAVGVAAFAWLVMAIFVVEYGGRLLTILVDGKAATDPTNTFAQLATDAVVALIAGWFGVTIGENDTGIMRSPTRAARAVGIRLTAGTGSPTINGVVGAIYSLVFVALAFVSYIAASQKADLTPALIAALPLTAFALAAAIFGTMRSAEI